MTNLKGNMFLKDFFIQYRYYVLISLSGILLGLLTLLIIHTYLGYGFHTESKPVNIKIIDQYERYIFQQTKVDNSIIFKKSSYFEEYMVKNGDTVYSVASSHHLTLGELLRFNNLTIPNTIYPYQLLNIPIKEKSVKVIMSSRSSLQLEDYVRLDLTKPSNLTSDLIDKFLSGTNLEGLGKAFIEAEKKYHVNAEYLMAHAIHESDWGKSKIAIDKKNLFGLKAYDKNPYKYAKGFSTYEDSIDYTAKYVSENYLSISGKYYNGPTLLGMNKMYATSKEWAYDIASIMKYFDKKVSV